MKPSHLSETEAREAGRLAEIALRASLGALQDGDLLVIAPPDLETGAPDPGAERLEAFAQKYNVPMVRMHWPKAIIPPSTGEAVR